MQTSVVPIEEHGSQVPAASLTGQQGDELRSHSAARPPHPSCNQLWYFFLVGRITAWHQHFSPWALTATAALTITAPGQVAVYRTPLRKEQQGKEESCIKYFRSVKLIWLAAAALVEASVTSCWKCSSFSITAQLRLVRGSRGSRSSLHFLNWQLEKLYSTGRDKRHRASEECVAEEREEW